MVLSKSQADAYNSRKIADFERRRDEAEDMKRAVAQLNGEIANTQIYLQTSISRFESFRPILVKQSNLSQRLDMMERAILMLSNQLNAIKPKIYMVDEPQYPNLKIVKASK